MSGCGKPYFCKPASRFTQGHDWSNKCLELKGLLESRERFGRTCHGIARLLWCFETERFFPKRDGAILLGILTHPSVGPASGVGLLCNLMIRYGGVHVPIHSNLALRPDFLTCSICNEPVELETTKIDERGKPIHEECYLQKVTLKWPIRPPPTAIDANVHANPTPLSRAIVAFLDTANLRPLTDSCPDCGSQLTHRECSFFYRGQTWEIRIPVCLHCHPISGIPPYAA